MDSLEKPKKPRGGVRFKPGNKANPWGRKGKSLVHIGSTLMQELSKLVDANINGKPVRATQYELFVQQLIKDAITKGPASKRLLIQFMESHEKREAAKKAEEANADNAPRELTWGEVQEKMYQKFRDSVAQSAAKNCR
jgi:Family of unknown function (DUF5681)